MKPGSRKSTGGPASMGARGGSRHGKPHKTSSGTLSSLPGRMAAPKSKSSFSSSESGPSPAERLAKAASGHPVSGKPQK